MSIKTESYEIVCEALDDSIKAVELYLEYRKIDNGCLGYPAAILLLSIIDTIGSYYQNKDIQINNNLIIISGNGNLSSHFNILNATDYFNFDYTKEQIKNIYSNFRCKLIHNHILQPNRFIVYGDDKQEPFSFKENNCIQMALIPLFEKCKSSVETFKSNANLIIKDSKIKQEIDKNIPILNFREVDSSQIIPPSGCNIKITEEKLKKLM